MMCRIRCIQEIYLEGINFFCGGLLFITRTEVKYKTDIGESVMIRDEKGVVRNLFYSQTDKMENNTISVQYVKESNWDF